MVDESKQKGKKKIREALEKGSKSGGIIGDIGGGKGTPVKASGGGVGGRGSKFDPSTEDQRRRAFESRTQELTSNYRDEQRAIKQATKNDNALRSQKLAEAKQNFEFAYNETSNTFLGTDLPTRPTTSQEFTKSLLEKKGITVTEDSQGNIVASDSSDTKTTIRSTGDIVTTPKSAKVDVTSSRLSRTNLRNVNVTYDKRGNATAKEKYQYLSREEFEKRKSAENLKIIKSVEKQNERTRNIRTNDGMDNVVNNNTNNTQNLSVPKKKTTLEEFQEKGVVISKEDSYGLRYKKTFYNVAAASSIGIGRVVQGFKEKPITSTVTAVTLYYGGGLLMRGAMALGMTAKAAAATIGVTSLGAFGLYKEKTEPGSVTTLPGAISTTSEAGVYAIGASGLQKGANAFFKSTATTNTKAENIVTRPEGTGQVTVVQAKTIVKIGGKEYEVISAGKEFSIPGKNNVDATIGKLKFQSGDTTAKQLTSGQKLRTEFGTRSITEFFTTISRPGRSFFQRGKTKTSTETIANDGEFTTQGSISLTKESRLVNLPKNAKAKDVLKSVDELRPSSTEAGLVKDTAKVGEVTYGKGKSVELKGDENINQFMRFLKQNAKTPETVGRKANFDSGSTKTTTTTQSSSNVIYTINKTALKVAKIRFQAEPTGTTFVKPFNPQTTTERQSTKVSSKSLSKQSQSITEKTVQITNTKSEEIFKTTPSIKTESIIRTIPAVDQSQSLRQAQKTAQKQKSFQEQLLKNTRSVRSFSSAPINPPAPNSPRIPPVVGLLDKESSFSRSAFNVQIRRQGKFETVAQGLPEGRALKLGSDLTKRSIAATFRLTPSGSTTQKDINFKPDERIFREYESKDRKKRQVPLQFIERSKYRLSTGSEVRAIQDYRRLRA